MFVVCVCHAFTVCNLCHVSNVCSLYMFMESICAVCTVCEVGIAGTGRICKVRVAGVRNEMGWSGTEWKRS